VAVGRQADDGAVAEEVVLALDLPGPLTGVEVDLAIAGIVVRERHGVTPFASLHDHVGVGKLHVPATMVVVKMRVHDAGDLFRRDRHGRQTRRDLLPGAEVEGGVLRADAADVGLRVGLGSEIETAVEQHLPRGMDDQIGGDRHGDPAFGRLEQEAVRDGQEAAGVGVELEAHGSLPRAGYIRDAGRSN